VQKVVTDHHDVVQGEQGLTTYKTPHVSAAAPDACKRLPGIGAVQVFDTARLREDEVLVEVDRRSASPA